MAYYATYMPNELGELQKVVINAGVGFVLPYYGTEAPPGTLACDGSAVSRQAYKELFQVLGTKAGAGDGSTTFNLPDLRGLFLRGLNGTNAAELGVEQGDAIRNITGYFGLRASQDPTTCVTQVTSGGVFYNAQAGGGTGYPNTSFRASGNRNVTGIDASRQVPTANENRPVNVALLWCIIYE